MLQTIMNPATATGPHHKTQAAPSLLDDLRNIMKTHLAALALLLAVLSAHANSNIYHTAFISRYPGTVGTAIGNCRVCHVGPQPDRVAGDLPRTAYGLSFAAQANRVSDSGAALAAIESLDSDCDNQSNLAEINARTFPGEGSGAPGVCQQPVSQIVFFTNDFQLSAMTAGSAPLTYQWFFKGKKLLGATSPTLVRTKAKTSASGDYFLTVENSLGSATSAVAHVEVVKPVVIKRQPVSRTVRAGKRVVFSVVATGTKPLYQWFFNGNVIPGATGKTYPIVSVDAQDQGIYTVRVSNAGNGMFSSDALLMVTEP